MTMDLKSFLKHTNKGSSSEVKSTYKKLEYKYKKL